jgi:hypothetical protein
MAGHNNATGLGAEEVILAPPDLVRPMTHARSTILIGSLAAIQASHGERYAAALSPKAREVLLHLVAGTWVPVDLALEHYRACETLGLPLDEQLANGRETFARAGATIFGTMTRMAREVGVTPWTLLPHMQRFWDRGYDGGGISVIKTGPKDCRVEATAIPLFRSPYYRVAVRGVVWSVFELFSRKVFVSERKSRSPDAIVLHAQWV